MIDQAIVRFLSHVKYVRGGAKNTVIAYQTDLRQFQQVLSNRDGSNMPHLDLSAADLKPYFNWLEEQSYQQATVARKLAALRSFFSYLEQEEGISADRILSALALPEDKRQAPKALSRADIQRLLAAPAGGTSARQIRDAAILAFLYVTGLKAAEAVRVSVHDVDIQRSVLDRPGAETDPIPLGIAHHAVERYVKEGRPQLLRNRGEPTLFLNQRGTGLTRQGLWLVVKRWAKACNLPDDVSPYTLRHSLTQHLLSSGRSRQDVQQRLGLSSPNTIRYHLSAQTS